MLEQMPQYDQLAHRVAVLSGPSGVGKGTVIDYLKITHPEVQVAVSATTRMPRPYEIDGEHYRFLSDDAFDAAIQAGDFIEYSTYGANRYGTLRSEVVSKLASGCRLVLLEIEINGTANVRAALPGVLTIFLLPPSLEILKQRLLKRGTETPEKVNARLIRAQAEIASKDDFDICLINETAEVTAAIIGNILERYETGTIRG